MSQIHTQWSHFLRVLVTVDFDDSSNPNLLKPEEEPIPNGNVTMSTKTYQNSQGKRNDFCFPFFAQFHVSPMFQPGAGSANVNHS